MISRMQIYHFFNSLKKIGEIADVYIIYWLKNASVHKNVLVTENNFPYYKYKS